MTDSNLLELAKLGDPQAIAALMNQSLQSRGMNATVDRQGDVLEVILEAERVPNRQALTAFVQQGVNNLGIQSITSIRILGQQVGASYPAWMQEVQLGAQEGTSDELSNLTASDLTASDLAASDLAAAAPLNIQPETEAEITAIPLNHLSEPEMESADLTADLAVPADLSFLPDSDPIDSSDSDLADPDDLLAALADPTVPSDQDLDALWSPTPDMAPDFLQELLADDPGAVEPRSLFAESPDGTLDTLDGSLPADEEMDSFFSDLSDTDRNEIQAPTYGASAAPDLLASSELAAYESAADQADATDTLLTAADVDLLDFLDESDQTQESEPEPPTLDLTDPADSPAATSMGQLSDFGDAEGGEAEEQPDEFLSALLSETPDPNPSVSDSVLDSQIEDLFNAEIDQPGGAFTEEILPERPPETTDDLIQSLVSEAPIAAAPEPLQDPWTAPAPDPLPDLSEARTVLDLPDDPAELDEGLPDFLLEPSPDLPDQPLTETADSTGTPADLALADLASTNALNEPALDDSIDADTADDLNALFADEEPPISIASDPIFYESIADEELAEGDLEELPPDFLQDFSAEFPSGFPTDAEVEAPLPAEILAEPIDQPLPLSLVESSTDEVDQANEPTAGNDFLADLIPPLTASGSLAAELAALDLITDLDPDDSNPDTSNLNSDPTFANLAADDPALEFQLGSDQLNPDQPNPDQLVPSDELSGIPSTDLPDADLADLLSETPQGTAIESDPISAEAVPPPQPGDFFSEPIAPVAATSAFDTMPSLQSQSPELLEPPVATPPPSEPEVSQDALEAGLGDFREGFVEPLPEEFFQDQVNPRETDWQADLRDPLNLTDDPGTDYIIEDSTPAVVYTPPPVPEKAQPAPTSGSPSWLFPLVLFIVGGWIAGLLSFALLWSKVAPPPSPPPATEPPATTPSAPSPVPASPTSKQPASPVANLPGGTPLKSAVEQASDAVALTQAAQSADDWGLVASKWQQAVNLLRSVPNTSPDYATAQQKLADYQSNVTTARQKANLPIVAAAPLGLANVANQPVANQPASPAASPGPTAAGIVCNSIPSAPNSQPVELSSVQFDPTVEQPQASPIVGCITNHTEQPIAAVNVAYKNSTSTADETTGGLNFGKLDPKQTVPFKSVFTVTSAVTDLTIATISWTVTGSPKAQQLPAAISVTRAEQDG